MASSRESKGSTKIAVQAPSNQKSQRTRNSPRPPPAPENAREFDPQVFLSHHRRGQAGSSRPNNLYILLSIV